MIALQLWHLRRFCDKHNLDYQEIDDTLTYSENKDHLISLVPNFDSEAPFQRLPEWESAEEQYMKQHILSYYIMCIVDGETTSKEVGAPMEPRFSLAAYIKSTK